MEAINLAPRDPDAPAPAARRSFVVAAQIGFASPLRGVGVDPLAMLQCHQALDVPHIGQRTGQIAVLGVALAVFFDGLAKWRSARS
jgi:hypothetical protein